MALAIHGNFDMAQQGRGVLDFVNDHRRTMAGEECTGIRFGLLCLAGKIQRNEGMIRKDSTYEARLPRLTGTGQNDPWPGRRSFPKERLDESINPHCSNHTIQSKDS